MVYKSAEVQRFFGIQHARVADACSSSTMEQLGLALLESHTLDKDWENSDEESSDGSDWLQRRGNGHFGPCTAGNG